MLEKLGVKSRVKPEGKLRKIDSLFGTLSLRPVAGFRIYVHVYPDSETAIELVDCHVIVGKHGRFSNLAKFKFNILGRSTLERFALYLDRPGVKSVAHADERPIGFLTPDGENLNTCFDGLDGELKDYMEQRKLPLEEIDWLD
ncbi:MAG: hypothetical protein ACYTFA_18260 [Planctomycetota bacterium]